MSADGALLDANRLLLKKLLVVAVAMFGFGFALVPFYEKLCEVAGLRDVFRADEPAVRNTQVDLTRNVAVEFDVECSIIVHPGEVRQVIYEVRNTLDRTVTGQAVPSYGPQRAGEYFRKLECFCFQKQTLGPHEVRRMPVVFVIDPKLPADLGTITLSYTFFEVAGSQGGKSS